MKPATRKTLPRTGFVVPLGQVDAENFDALPEPWKARAVRLIKRHLATVLTMPLDLRRPHDG